MDTDIALPAGLKKRPVPVGTISYFISGFITGKSHSLDSKIGCKDIIKSVNKKLFPDSRRRTATTQTQNKTRQNYYAKIQLPAFISDENQRPSIIYITYTRTARAVYYM